MTPLADIKERGTLTIAYTITAQAPRRAIWLACGPRLRQPAREDLIAMMQGGKLFVVDAITGEDVTFSFRPIIVEH